VKVNQSNNPAVNNNQAADIKNNSAAKIAEIKAKMAEGNVTKNGRSTNAMSPDISSKAKGMARAHEVATQAPDVREDRVAALKQKIQSGEYKVDAEGLADKILSEHMSTQGIG